MSTTTQQKIEHSSQYHIDKFTLRPAFADKIKHSICDLPESAWNELGLPGGNPAGPSTSCPAGEAMVKKIEESLRAHNRPAADFERATGHLGGTKEWNEINEALGTSAVGAAVGATGKAVLSTAQATEHIAEALGSIGKLVAKLFSHDFLIRGAEIVGGLALVYVGLKNLTGTGASDLPGAKTAGRIVRTAAAPGAELARGAGKMKGK